MKTPRSLTVLLTAFTLATGCHAASESAPTGVASADTGAAIQGWPHYGGKDAGQHAELTDITPQNVNQLELAWSHHSGDFSDGSGEWGLSSLQVTPLVDGDTLYYCTPFGRVFALNAETGEERWVFDPEVENRRSGMYPVVCRGVALWRAAEPDEAAASCG
ncbi:MAG TPA: hypothetical protein DCQ70_10800, partial [Halieaceae bacterium]|nr:hypothetical protein [Halieaceae bacterium]